MSLIAELKRRKVFKIGAAYLVVAWLAVQAASIGFPAFDAPPWALRVFILIALLGFPIAVVMAWVFDITPEGVKLDAETSGSKRLFAVAGLLIVLAVGWYFYGQPSFRRGDAATPASTHASVVAAPSVDPHAIAVLAFDDLSPAHDQADFSDGMAEEILNALTRIKSLKVIARSSSFQFKGKDISPQQIGAQLGVAHVLEGSVRKQGEQLRITATLVQTSDGVQQWSNTYDGKLADVFDLQESCAHDIAMQLNAVLGDNGKQRLVDRSTDNADAYALFVEAQTLVNARVGDSLPHAIAMLGKATTLDPKFARAWSKLAVAYAVLTQYVGGDWTLNLDKSEAAAHRAIALDSNNAEAYAALAYVSLSRRQFVEMGDLSERALALDPDDATADSWGGNELIAMGRSADAEATYDRILTRDPANILALFFKGTLRWMAGDQASAVVFSRRVEALGSPFGGLNLSFDAGRRGDYRQGEQEYARALGSFGATATAEQLRMVYRGMYGSNEERSAALAMLQGLHDSEWSASLLIMLGEPEHSFETFERRKSGLSDAYLNFLWFPDAWSRKARQSPAFQGFAKRIGLVDYWKQNRWPDLCSPMPENGPDAFACR